MKVFHTSFGHTVYKTTDGKYIGFASRDDKNVIAETIKVIITDPGRYSEDPPDDVEKYKDGLTLVFEC